MSTNNDDESGVYSAPKGGLFGGPFDPAGLDPNVRALLMDFRWTTSADGAQPATTISYFFPQQASDYTSVAGYPSATQIGSFADRRPEGRCSHSFRPCVVLYQAQLR